MTLTTDLLMGIGAGIVLESILNLWYVGLWHSLRNGSEFAQPNFAVRFLSLFRNPVSQREFDDGTYHLYLDGPRVFSNLFRRDSGAGAVPDGHGRCISTRVRVCHSSITRQVSPCVIP